MKEFRKLTGRNIKPQVWKIYIDPNNTDVYKIEWGVLNGSMQYTSNRPGSCGDPNHSDYQSPNQYAITCMEREIRKKIEHGYVEYINGKPLNETENSIDFSQPLPKNLCFFKPKKTISDIKLQKLYKNNRAIWTLKRDGMCHIVVKSNDNLEIYSRRMDIVTEKFPHILKSIENLNLPNNTILLGEICSFNKDGSDNFQNVSKVCRSDKDLSLAYQGFTEFPKRRKNEKVLGITSYYVFDIPFFNGEDLISTTNIYDRLKLLKKMFQQFDSKLYINAGLKRSESDLIEENKRRRELLYKYHVGPVQIYHTNPTEDINLAKRLKIEGFVILDAQANYGDRAYSFDGKAHRPDGIFKRKPIYEDEFVITGVYSGSGRNRNRLGGFTIKQIHPITNEWIDCGKCGGGFSDDQREQFWNEKDDLINKTIKVEFDSRQPEKDGVFSLRFPIFKGYSDKEPHECIAQGL